MLSRLQLKDFTVFAEADFRFSPGLNVIIGTNGAGKSHVLKVGYAVLRQLERRLRSIAPPINGPQSVDNEIAEADDNGLRRKLINVFRPAPEKITGLMRGGSNILETEILFEINEDEDSHGTFLIYSHGSSMESSPPFSAINAAQKGLLFPSVFIPAKEVVTLSWMLPASDQLKLPIDETYIDLLRQLRGLPLRQPEPAAAAALETLTNILGGEVEEESGRYYLNSANQSARLEMNMVAEGLRKFGTLQKLLSNGSLTPRTTLFWDEPESNLNPALLRQLAELLANLARAGFRIILATHSLFLLKQFHILSRAKDQSALPIRYFGLNTKPDGPTEVVAVDDFEKLPDIVALEEEIIQSGEFLDVLNQSE
ncbi:AAA family ATPase [Hymenobacter sp.]|jgi:hypothetical protein|uniref:AAA family ATPase n=1 Tax=Hymenobacter sp. TaxID=1898978 RepID=UPI002EDAE12C